MQWSHTLCRVKAPKVSKVKISHIVKITFDDHLGNPGKNGGFNTHF